MTTLRPNATQPINIKTLISATMNLSLNSIIFFVCMINLSITCVSADWLMKCGICKCKWNSGKKTAECKSVHITNIPTNLSAEVQVLDLSSNLIPEVKKNEFIEAGLSNLHKLFIRNTTLKLITNETFQGLGILIELDISNNLLRSLPSNIFGNLIKLRALILNNNLLERLQNGLFQNMSYLHKIELKGNQLIRIESKAFINLPLLTQIYLDRNKLHILRRESFDKLPKLTSLSLESNPWNCTCALKSFRDFAFEQNLYTPPTDCYDPPNLRGILWSDASVHAFACKPEILYPRTAASSTTTTIIHNSLMDNVTLSCRIHSSPNTIITWTYNKHSFTNYPKRIYIRNVSEPNRQNTMELLTSELTIVGVKKSDEGTYTCVSQNAGGKSEVDIVLTVQKTNSAGNLFTTNLLLILCLLAVGLLVASLIIMTLTCCYCHKFKKLAKQDLADNKKQFEEIKLNSLNNGTTTLVKGSCSSDSAFDGVGGSGGGIVGCSAEFEIQKQHTTNSITSASSDHDKEQHQIKQQVIHLPPQYNHHQQLQQRPQIGAQDCNNQIQSSSNRYHHSSSRHRDNTMSAMPSTATAHSTNNFITGDKSNEIVNEINEIKRVLYGDNLTSEFEIPQTSTNNDCGTKLTTPANRYLLNNSDDDYHHHQQHHHQNMYDQQQQSVILNARLPPDLLTYGPQSMSLQQNSSLNPLLDGSLSSATSNNENYLSSYENDNDEIFYKPEISNSKFLLTTIVPTNSASTTTTVLSKGLHRRNSSQDLHIKFNQDCFSNSNLRSSSLLVAGGGSGGGSGGFGRPGSSSGTNGDNGGGIGDDNISNRSSNSNSSSSNNGSCSGMISSGNGGGHILHKQYTTLTHRNNVSTSSVHFTTSKLDTSCKPRQSIVRTSPSFSFLSNGCQQPNNFL